MFSLPVEWYQKHHQTKNIIGDYLTYLNIFLSRIDKPLLTYDNLQLDKIPQIAYIDYPSAGNMELKKKSLLNYINEINKNKPIITPSGSTFYSQYNQSKISHLNKFISEKKSQRKLVKKDMLRLESEGKSYEARIKHFEQLYIKRGINSISGVANRNVYFKSTPVFNAITSTARHNVTCGYVAIERLIAGNFYFADYDMLVNHIVSVIHIYPGDDKIKKVVNKYKLHIPSYQDVFEFLNTCVFFIMTRKEKITYKKLLKSLSAYERVFLFYVHNLFNVFMYNSKTFKKYIDSMFISDFSYEYIPNDIDINKVDFFELDDQDLLIFVSTIAYKKISGLTLEKINKYPEYIHIKKDIIGSYFYIEHRLKALNELFSVFLLVHLNIQQPFRHKNMLRRSVILSDTDSNIFTTILWIYWYTGDIKITDDAIKIHSLFVYFITKFIEHILAISCKECNIHHDYIKNVSMKNEFYYPTLIRTIMSKHYFGEIMIKEGVVLPKHKLDFKGKNFIGSDLSPTVAKKIKDLVQNQILKSFRENNKLDRQKIIKYVIDIEQDIKRSIEKRETRYLFNIPIKNPTEYKDHIKSYYFLYMLWEKVFAPSYGHVNVPAKMNVLPLNTILRYQTIDKNQSLEYLKKDFPEIFRKLKTFLSSYQNKKLRLILIPQDVQFNEVLCPIVDYRQVITRNIFGIYLIIKSLNISVPPLYENILFSDIYN